MRRLVFGGLLCAIAGLCGCVLDRPVHVVLGKDVRQPARSVVIFLVDGLDRTRLRSMLAADQLPNIRDRLVEGGVCVEHAVTSLPSVTYPNCASLITGRFPGHHGILGNFWFDRDKLEVRDYMRIDTYRMTNQDFQATTVYELLDDLFTLSLQNHTRRGVTVTIDNENMLFWSWAFGRYRQADRYVGLCMEEVSGIANQMKEWPSILMTYYPGVDEVGHHFGSDSDQYRRALISFDRVLGRITGALDGAGLRDSVFYCLVSDHSMVQRGPDQAFDMINWVRARRGLRLLTVGGTLPVNGNREKAMLAYDAVAAVDAGRVCMIHLPSSAGWQARPSWQELDAWIDREPRLLDNPAVEAVCMRVGTDRVRVRFRQGMVLIERRLVDGQRQYRIAEEQGDPLGYRNVTPLLTFVEQGWHESREWLAATVSTRFPDFVPQVVEMFDSERTGDLVVMAAEGWTFNPAEQGGHGSCLAQDMFIPLYFAGPGLPKGASVATARLVDVMPTLVSLLGYANRLPSLGPIDGIDLSEQLRRAGMPMADHTALK